MGIQAFMPKGQEEKMVQPSFIGLDVLEDNNVNKEVGQVSHATTTLQYEHSYEKLTDRGDPNDPQVRLRRDCVGIMAGFRVLPALEDRVFLLANTQIYWDPDWLDVKLAQVNYLTDRILKFQCTLETSLKLRKFPIIICGDFNSTPGDQVYNYLVHDGGEVSVETKLSNLSLYSENKISRKCLLPLHSLYGSVLGEPECTNCVPGFKGTLDYIFVSSFDTMKPVSLLQTPTLDVEDVMNGLPNQTYPSDHLPIGTDFMILSSKHV